MQTSPPALTSRDLEASLNALPFTLDASVYSTVSRQRRTIMIMMGSVLDQYADFKRLPREEQSMWVEEIESSCFDKAMDKAKEDRIYVDWENPRFMYSYQLICSRVSKNLDLASEVSNDWLFKQLFSGNIERGEIASLSSEQLTDRSNNIQDMIAFRRKQKLNYKTSTLYTCKNCKAKKCTVRTQQMRSLDEGFTIICNCTVCGYRFMISG